MSSTHDKPVGFVAAFFKVSSFEFCRKTKVRGLKKMWCNNVNDDRILGYLYF